MNLPCRVSRSLPPLKPFYDGEAWASALATSNLIAVRPVIGWWRERHHLGKVNRRTRYALIVSIETPGIASNIYAAVAAKRLYQKSKNARKGLYTRMNN